MQAYYKNTPEYIVSKKDKSKKLFGVSWFKKFQHFLKTDEDTKFKSKSKVKCKGRGKLLKFSFKILFKIIFPLGIDLQQISLIDS